jgi:hypothetical protein
MKRQGRVLHFAVTGALLGSAGIGCTSKHHGLPTNPGPMDGPPPEEQLHVNPGPDEDPGAAEGGGAEGGGAEGGPGEPPLDVNPGPVESGTNDVRKVEDEPGAAPEPNVRYVNTVRQPDPPPTPKK